MFLKKFYVVSILTTLLVLPVMVSADGLIVPPYDYDMYETEQKAVIFHEDGTESLVLSIDFEGYAEDFGWLVPVPSQPTVTKSSDELFTSLEALTAEHYGGRNDITIFSGDLKEAQDGVTVIEKQKIDYYEVTTLQASDSTSLSDWLVDNDYNFPPVASSYLDSYTDNDWFFVAMKIDAGELEGVAESELKTGHATPVMITFATETIVYPMKLTGAMSFFGSDEATEDFVVINNNPTYKTGKIGKAASLMSRDVLSLPLNLNYNSQKGAIALWIKDVEMVRGSGTQNTFISIVDNYEDKLVDLYAIGSLIEYKTYLEGGGSKVWQAYLNGDITDTDWHQLVLTWDIDSSPLLYFDGQLMTTTSPTIESETNTIEVIKTASSGTIYIGQDGSNLGSNPLNGVIDELAFFQRALNVDQIDQTYTQGSYPLLDSLLWSASFEENLNFARLGGEYDKLDYYRQTQKSRVDLPTSMQITLYVIASHRQTIPGFDTTYASSITDKEVEDLAYNDQLQPWIDANKSKYYLTKLSRYMQVSEMNNDLVLRQAEDNTAVNAPDDTESSSIGFKVVMVTGSFFSAVMLAVIAYLMNKKEPSKNSNKRSKNSKLKNNGQ